MLNESDLTTELQALAAQRAEATAQLARIDGAEQMARHLLGKLADRRAEDSARARLAELAQNNEALRGVLGRGGLTPEECGTATTGMPAQSNGQTEREPGAEG